MIKFTEQLAGLSTLSESAYTALGAELSSSLARQYSVGLW